MSIKKVLFELEYYEIVIVLKCSICKLHDLKRIHVHHCHKTATVLKELTFCLYYTSSIKCPKSL